ncbi:hypothetical protein P4408_08300 [Bacillus thuringiensis]
MKKILSLFMGIALLFVLGACGKDTAGDLESTKWNVVATNGESYTAEFSKNTVSFKMGSFARGFSYKINDSEISLEEDGKQPVTFEISKDGDEYKFKATNSAIKKKFGDLTLSPSKEK